MERLSWKVADDAGRAVVTLTGAITEDASFANLAQELEGKTHVQLDLGGVRRINSAGVREWIRFIRPATEKADVQLVKCSPAVVGQLNVFFNFAASARIASILAPFLCDECDEEAAVPVDLAERNPRLPPLAPTCPKCGRAMEFDDLVDHYFHFMTLKAEQSGGSPGSAGK